MNIKQKSLIKLSIGLLIISVIIIYNLNDSLQKTSIENKTSQINDLTKEEVSLQPKDWTLTNYKGDIFNGEDIFIEDSLLVFFLAKDSCPSCVEEEIFELNKSVENNKNLSRKVLLVSSFKTMNEFKVFVNSLGANSINFYNRSGKTEFEYSDFVGYFLWNNGKANNFYKPRFDDKKQLNKEYRDNVFKKIAGKNEKMALYIINGNQSLKPLSYFSEFDDSNVEHITILNPETGKIKYGRNGENGVYIITARE